MKRYRVIDRAWDTCVEDTDIRKTAEETAWYYGSFSDEGYDLQTWENGSLTDVETFSKENC